MSYLPIDTDNQNHIDDMSEESTKINPRFSGHTHSQLTKDKIAMKQRAKYEALRKLAKKGMETLTEERVATICKEEIDKYFKKNLLKVNENKRPININL